MSKTYDPNDFEYTITSAPDGYTLVSTSHTETEAIPMLGGGYCYTEVRIHELRKNGVMVASGVEARCGQDLTHFPAPGTEDMLRGVLDDMMAEQERKDKAERLERQRQDEMDRLEYQRRERIAAAAALGLDLPDLRDFDERVRRLRASCGIPE